MLNQNSSLPDAWIERIWTTMRANYGASFDRQWEVPAGVDPVAHVAQMKAYWGSELAGYQQSPAAIKHALSILPDFPPNLPQFKALLRSAPMYHVPALPPPKVEYAEVAPIIQAMRRPVQDSPKAWAWKLREREQAGSKNLTKAQRDAWREALESELIAERCAA